MAKKQQPTQFPPIDELDPIAAPAKTIETVRIEAPTMEFDPQNYYTRKVEVQMDNRQSIALKRLFVGLDEKGERLANGRRVISPADAVRWLLERIAHAN